MKRMMKVVMEKVLNLVQGLGLHNLLNLTPPDPGVYTAPTGTVCHRRRNRGKPAGSSLRGAPLGCNRGRWRQRLPAGTPRWAQIARMQ